MNKTTLAVFLIGLTVVSLKAQIVDIGPQDPPGIKWKKIDTPHFEVVFPQELTHVGQQTANTMEYLYEILGKTLNQELRRITIILSNQGVISNGYVTLAPRRTEWFNMPMSSHAFGVVDWLDILAVHEGRHIVQFDKLNKGITKLAGFFMGELGRLISTIYSTPLWFFEGDAVGIETALTDGGRGRQPAFDMDTRALLLSGKRYSYDKAYLRSYKDWCPSEYPLGYLLTTQARRKFGPEIWSKVIDRAARKSWLYPSFSRALKKETGKSVVGLYEDTMDELEAGWNEKSKKVSLTDFRAMNTAPRKVWTNYTFPRYDIDGTLYVQKIGLAHPLLLMRLHRDGKEEKITPFAPLQSLFNRLSVERGMAVWNEYVPDPRWGKRSDSDIVLYDLKRGRRRRLTHHARLFDPSLSPDGKKIAAVEFSADSRCALVILSSETGREIKRFSNPDGDLVFFPAWSEDGGRIVAARQNTQGRALSIFNVHTEERQDILPLGRESFGYPVFYKDFILYDSPRSGIDNIYAVNIRTRERRRVTSSRFGAFFPDVSPDGKNLVYCDYSVNGYDVAETPLDPSTWKSFEKTEYPDPPYYEPLISQEQGGSVFKKGQIPNVEYEVENYAPSAHLLNVHSWIPLIDLPEMSFLLISSDKLSKSLLVGGLKYHTDEKVAGFVSNGSYAGLFPVLDFGVGYGGRSAAFKNENNEEVACSWRETSAHVGFHIPLDLSRGSYRCSLDFGAKATYTRISDRDFTEPLKNGNGRLLTLDYRLNYIKLRQPSIRDLYPTWGHYCELSFYHTPWKGDYKGKMSSIEIGLFLPGLLKHHSLRIRGGYEKQLPDNYRFANDVLFSRGYDYKFHGTFYKVSADYAFPLAYPDCTLGSFLYLKRLKINLFYDHGLGRSHGDRQYYQSVGMDFLADFHLFRLPVEIEMGPRFVYRLKDKHLRMEWLVFGIGL